MKNEAVMTLKIELPDDQTAALAAKARACGVSVEEYARQVLARDLTPGWLRNAWSEARQTAASALSMDDIDAEIAAARRDRSR
jgi:plasmid stability protein